MDEDTKSSGIVTVCVLIICFTIGYVVNSMVGCEMERFKTSIQIGKPISKTFPPQET